MSCALRIDPLIQVFFVICFERPQSGSQSAGGTVIGGAETWCKVLSVCCTCLLSSFFSLCLWVSLFYPLFLPFCCSSFSVGISPKVLLNHPVVAIYQNSASSILGVVKSFVMFISLPPVLLHSACLAAWCAVQCSRKCCTVSLLCWQSGQIGESLFPIWLRCLASGACPVLSCESMLAIFCGKSMIRSTYLHDGVVGLVFFICSYCGNFCHAFCALHFGFLP